MGGRLVTLVMLTGKRKVVRKSARHLVAVVVSLVFFVPILVAIITSLKSNASALTSSVLSLPHHLDFSNYRSVLDLGGFANYTKVSAIVSIGATIVQVGVATCAGYGFAKLRFRGRGLLFMAVLLTLMLPPAAVALPLFLEMMHFPLLGGNSIGGTGGIGLLNSYPGLMAPYLVSGFSVFLARQFFSTLPDELGEAARIDGCSEWAVFWRIYRPLATPLIVIVTLFAFQTAWVDFLWPLIVAKGPSLFTLQVGLSSFQQEYTAQWSDIMAAAILASLPIMAIFIFGQRYLRRGIAWSGGKS
ncbi:MAG: carbohydrate ABC transporter permease [Actinomycetota bacterium]|nr:carbohydrate ABC transporter permease [Actinomycetota bacterium]